MDAPDLEVVVDPVVEGGDGRGEGGPVAAAVVAVVSVVSVVVAGRGRGRGRGRGDDRRDAGDPADVEVEADLPHPVGQHERTLPLRERVVLLLEGPDPVLLLLLSCLLSLGLSFGLSLGLLRRGVRLVGGEGRGACAQGEGRSEREGAGGRGCASWQSVPPGRVYRAAWTDVSRGPAIRKPRGARRGGARSDMGAGSTVCRSWDRTWPITTPITTPRTIRGRRTA